MLLYKHTTLSAPLLVAILFCFEACGNPNSDKVSDATQQTVHRVDSGSEFKQNVSNDCMLKIATVSNDTMTSYDTNSFDKLTEVELQKMLPGKTITQIDCEMNRVGPFQEIFQKSGAWDVTIYSRALRSFTGDWKLKGDEVIVRSDKTQEIRRHIFRSKSNKFYMKPPMSGNDNLLLIDIY